MPNHLATFREYGRKKAGEIEREGLRYYYDAQKRKENC
jgi:hypothetical protein